MPTAATYRRRRLVAAVAAVMLLWGVGSLGGQFVAALARPLPELTLHRVLPVDAAAAKALITLPSQGRLAVSVDGFSDPIVYSGDQGAAAIASITKVITALVVLEAKPLAGAEDGQRIIFTAADVDRYREMAYAGESVVTVHDGLSLSERDTLAVMLVGSANNYAAKLAEWAFGSVAGFLDKTREWLTRNGLTATTVTEPSGLAPTNRATPIDLIRLGKLALADPTVAQIVAQPRISVAGVGEISNTNPLLTDGTAIGIKTGTTTEAGACLLFASTARVGTQTIRIVGVLLGSANHAAMQAAVRSVLRGVKAALSEFNLPAGTPIGEVTSAWDARTTLVTTADLRVIRFSNQPAPIAISVNHATTGDAGTIAGELELKTGSQRQVVPLAFSSALADPGVFWRLAHPDR